MNILGIGPFEIVLILIVAFVFLGPRDLAKTGRTVGRFLRKIVMSAEWRAIRQVAHEIQTTPNRLMREAGIEEEQMRQALNPLHATPSRGKPGNKPQDFEELDGFAAWTRQPPGNSILPPPASPAPEPPAPDTAPPEA